MELYRTEGIDTSGVTRNQLMSSGAAFIIVEESGENLISVDSGSNRALLPTDVENQKQLLSNSRVVLTQMEIPAETAMAAMRVGRESGTTTILNPAPYQHIEDGWENVDIVTPNETEARLITGKPPNQPAEPALLARSIMDKGVGSVVLTLGAAGAFVMSPSFTGLVPGRKVSAIDTTGAGDAFAGALATATAEGRDLESAVKFAVVAASLAVTKYGVIASLPFRNDVDQATSGVL
jgi:ribokinase